MATKSNKSRYTGKKARLAEMLTNPEFTGTVTELCTSVGVARSTFYKWMDDKDYLKYIETLIDKYTDSELSTVWKALIHRCETGDVQAIKLYFELKGKYSSKVEVSGTLKAEQSKLDDLIEQMTNE